MSFYHAFWLNTEWNTNVCECGWNIKHAAVNTVYLQYLGVLDTVMLGLKTCYTDNNQEYLVCISNSVLL